MTKKLTKEASAVAAMGGSQVSDITGHRSGAGWPLGSSKKVRRKMNPSKPYGEKELKETRLFEDMVIRALLEGKSIKEVVKRRGEQWVYFDDETGAEKGVYQDRDTAWERQRQDRRTKDVRKQAKKAEKKRQETSLVPTVGKDPRVKDRKKQPKKAPKAKLAKKAKKEKKPVRPKVRKVESILRDMLKPLMETSMISYVFENSPISDESTMWDAFVGRLSKETVLSDPKLKRVLQDIAQVEKKLLMNAVENIKGVLSPGGFAVEVGKMELDGETKDIKLSFTVALQESKARLKFGVKLENGRPVILFPDETRAVLNDLGTEEAKLLRSELIHAQETVLNNMVDVVNVMGKRDKYLKSLEGKLDKLLDKISPLEISMLRYLLKQKYRGVK